MVRAPAAAPLLRRMLVLAALMALAASDTETSMRPAKLRSSARAERTAVALVIKCISSACDALRLLALLDATRAGVDVWVLHDANQLQCRYPLSADLPSVSRLLDALLREDGRDPPPHSWDGLHTAPQPSVAPQMHSLGDRFVFGMKTGDTKPAFFSWLAASSYTRAWFVEADVAFTGAWSHFFGTTERLFPKTDLVAHYVERARRHVPASRAHAYWYARNCNIEGRPCFRGAIDDPTEQPLLQLYFPIARVSARLARRLTQSMLHNGTTGHHEARTAHTCLLEHAYVPNAQTCPC